MNPVTPVVRGLLIACVAVFLLQQVSGPRLEEWFALWPLHLDPPYGAGFHAWQLVSYSFLHGDWLHLLMNMYGLYMFGPQIEQLLGARRFLIYYTVCVVSAALAQLAVQALGAPLALVVGASGGIFGILLAYALAYPRDRIVVIPIPVPLPAWLLVMLYSLVEIYYGITGTGAGVAHFAHLGGMVGGIVLSLLWRIPARVKRRTSVT